MLRTPQPFPSLSRARIVLAGQIRRSGLDVPRKSRPRSVGRPPLSGR